jgi:hypothetical protein
VGEAGAIAMSSASQRGVGEPNALRPQQHRGQCQHLDLVEPYLKVLAALVRGHATLVPRPDNSAFKHTGREGLPRVAQARPFLTIDPSTGHVISTEHIALEASPCRGKSPTVSPDGLAASRSSVPDAPDPGVGHPSSRRSGRCTTTLEVVRELTHQHTVNP